jgi:hypothetical protein
MNIASTGYFDKKQTPLKLAGSLKLYISNGLIWVGASSAFHLRMEADTVPETLLSLKST